MDLKRVILYAALVLIGYTLWTDWQVDYPAKVASMAQTRLDTTSSLSSDMVKESAANTISTDTQLTDTHLERLIQVDTDVLSLMIDSQHGDVVQAKLLEYPTSEQEKNKPIALLTDRPNDQYVANSRLMVMKGQRLEDADFNFTSSATHYKLDQKESQLIVTLTAEAENNLLIKKEFILTKGSYAIKVRYLIENKGTLPWSGYLNTQLLRTAPKEDQSSLFHIGSYTGASYSQPGKHQYQKMSFKQMHQSNLDLTVQGGWVAMQQHYFLSAWVPNINHNNRLYTRALPNGDYIIGALGPLVSVAPNDQAVSSALLYVGPEITSVLKSIAPGLDLTVDYGLLWFLSSLLFSFLKTVYSFVGNWGVSIILVTLLIKLAFYRLSATSYKSMANMRRLQPKLQALRERYGDDKAKMSQATMALYREEKVNPLGGCLPILVQIPVFIALYWVLVESVELRQAPFIFWITDLAAPDPYHVLPIIMGVTMLVQQRLNPAPPDPMQAKVMMLLPVFFTALFWGFPSGLVLYWVVNNTLSILQQWVITRKYSEDRPQKRQALIKQK